MPDTWRLAAERLEHQASQEGDLQARIQIAAGQLETFLGSADGRMALRLLLASNRFVRFGETEPEGGTACVFILNKDGPSMSVEAGGLSAAYSKKEPKLQTCTPHKLVSAAVQYRGQTPESVLPWLQEKINAIAAQVLETTPAPTSL